MTLQFGHSLERLQLLLLTGLFRIERLFGLEFVEYVGKLLLQQRLILDRSEHLLHSIVGHRHVAGGTHAFVVAPREDVRLSHESGEDRNQHDGGNHEPRRRSPHLPGSPQSFTGPRIAGDRDAIGHRRPGDRIVASTAVQRGRDPVVEPEAPVDVRGDRKIAGPVHPPRYRDVDQEDDHERWREPPPVEDRSGRQTIEDHQQQCDRGQHDADGDSPSNRGVPTASPAGHGNQSFNGIHRFTLCRMGSEPPSVYSRTRHAM